MTKKEKTFVQMVEAWDSAFADVNRYIKEHGVVNLAPEEYWCLKNRIRHMFFDYLDLHSIVGSDEARRYKENDLAMIEKAVERKVKELTQDKKDKQD